MNRGDRMNDNAITRALMGLMMVRYAMARIMADRAQELYDV